MAEEDEKMAETARLSPGAYWGQRLEGVKVETTEGEVPCTFTPERIVPREQFGQILIGAKKKIRAGQAITPLELSVLMRSRADWEDPVKTGPSKKTMKLLREVAVLSIKEGVEKMSDIAARLAVTPSALAMAINRHPEAYAKVIQETLSQLAQEDTAVNAVVRFRALRQMRKTALAAPGVVDEVMSDPDQPGGVRLKAADTALKAFGIGDKTVEEKTTINLSADKVLVAQQIMNEDAQSVIGSVAEEVEFEEVPVERDQLGGGDCEEDCGGDADEER